MKARFVLDELYPPHSDGSIVLGNVEAYFFSKLDLVPLKSIRKMSIQEWFENKVAY